MKILVTGGAGYIGSHVVQLLGEQKRHDVIVYDNLSTGRRESVLYGKLVVGDLGDETALTRLFDEHDFDAVIHFAASISAIEAAAQPLLYYKNNTCNTVDLIRQCRRRAVRYFVFSSTAAVYRPTASESISEDGEIGPLSPYGWSKLMSERVLMDAAEVCGMRYVILRYFNAAGADPGLRIGQVGKSAQHLIKVACQAAVGLRDGVDVYGSDYDTPDGSRIRDYIHVTDLADVHLKALAALEADEDRLTLNCGYGHGYSVKEILAETQRVTGVQFPIREAARRPVDAPQLVADNTRLKRKLNWQPRFDDVSTIIRTAWEWERKLRIKN